MKSTIFAAVTTLVARRVAGHATFQVLWVNGVDMISDPFHLSHGVQCARLPLSNSPVTDVLSNDIRCNANMGPASAKCMVPAGATVTVEMHQQNGDRSCANEAIGGAHHGPVAVYLSKVANSAAAGAEGTAGWFKVFEGSWAKNAAGANGDADFWGTKDLNNCCGKMDVKIPTDIPSGDYLLRAEALALHAAGGSQGAQFYMTCYQLTVTGGGSAIPATVQLPGAYAASNPGILVDIHRAMSSYTPPGPAVYSGGTRRTAGSACRAGCESSCQPGSGPSGTASSVPQPTGGGGTGGCTAAKYAQCGGTGWTGCTTCQAGSTCQAVSPPYYYQCA